MSRVSEVPRNPPWFHVGRPVWLALALALALFLAQTEVVLVTSVENGEFPVSAPVLKEDDFHHPRLALLRTRERLDEIVAGAKTEFDAIVRLRHWTHRQWETGDRFYYPPWDAVEILDLARRHDNRGFCTQYAVVMLQACQSMGLHARYVDLPGHFAVSVWSDDFDRWILMDPTRDVHYERDGVPLGGGALNRAYLTKNVRGLVQVDGEGRRTPVTPEDLSVYRLYAIDLAADQLAHPVRVEVDGVARILDRSEDYRTYPEVGPDRQPLVVESEFLAWHHKDAERWSPPRPETADREQFSALANQTVLSLANGRIAQGVVNVALLSANSPTFANFEIRSEGSRDWVPNRAPTVRWLLHPGRNTLAARVETGFGWKGPATVLQLFYKPALSDWLPAFRGNIVRLTWHREGPPV